MKTRTWKEYAAILAFSLCCAFAILGAAGGLERKAFSKEAEESCITATCHFDLGKKRYVHEPAGDGRGCTDCHLQPTGGDHSFKLSASGNALCTECHDDTVSGRFVHAPLKDGSCSDCHDPHQSDNPGQLILHPRPDLCYRCHDPRKFMGTIIHTPIMYGKCTGCHDPHSSDFPGQLEEPMPDLCFTCHDGVMKRRDGENIPLVKSLFEGKAFVLHKPFEEGTCTACHLPHASNSGRLLKGTVAGPIFATFKEEENELCLSCHPVMLRVLKEPRTTRDTNFRNGDMNLHFWHVITKGRTCNACHHQHGSTNDKLVRDTLAFGKKVFRMKFSVTNTGGTCQSACHEVRRYDRIKSVTHVKRTGRARASR